MPGEDAGLSFIELILTLRHVDPGNDEIVYLTHNGTLQ